MKRKALHYYLEDLNRLDEIPLESLEAWAKEEAYCQNIHFLVAKKLVRQKMTDNMKPFHRAATYAVDQRRLASFLAEEEGQKNQEKEVLQKKAKPKIKTEKKSTLIPEQNLPKEESKVVSPTPKKMEPKEKSGSVNKEVDGEQIDYKEISSKKKKKNSPKGKKAKSSKSVKKNKTSKETKVKTSAKIKDNTKTKKTKKTKHKKLSVKDTAQENLENYIRKTDNLSEFNQWLLDLRTQGGQTDIPYVDMAEKSKKSKKKSKLTDKKEAKKTKNTRESKDIISESLAHLLAKQGHKKKAIRMYKRLSLIIPEKSVFFASQIKALKKEK